MTNRFQVSFTLRYKSAPLASAHASAQVCPSEECAHAASGFIEHVMRSLNLHMFSGFPPDAVIDQVQMSADAGKIACMVQLKTAEGAAEVAQRLREHSLADCEHESGCDDGWAVYWCRAHTEHGAIGFVDYDRGAIEVVARP